MERFKEYLFDYLFAALAVFGFKPYTRMPRWIEIGYGILAWLSLGLIIYSGFMIYYK